MGEVHASNIHHNVCSSVLPMSGLSAGKFYSIQLPKERALHLNRDVLVKHI